MPGSFCVIAEAKIRPKTSCSSTTITVRETDWRNEIQNTSSVNMRGELSSPTKSFVLRMMLALVKDIVTPRTIG